MRKQFAKTLLELGQDERLIVLIGDISHFLLKILLSVTLSGFTISAWLNRR